jgi:hypothetical protein
MGKDSWPNLPNEKSLKNKHSDYFVNWRGLTNLGIRTMLSFLGAIPFASSSPDGLEKIAATYGVQEHTSLWNGLLADYSIGSIGDSYVSTVLAGVFGVFLVLLATFLLGKALVPRNRGVSGEQ